jgi:hypothetical protein
LVDYFRSQGGVDRSSIYPSKVKEQKEKIDIFDRTCGLFERHLLTSAQNSVNRDQREDRAYDRRDKERDREQQERQENRNERIEEHRFRDQRNAMDTGTYRPSSRSSTANGPLPIEPAMSSPVNSEADEDLIPKFFEWRLQSVQNFEARERIENHYSIVLDAGFSVNHLKAMANRRSDAHKDAIAAGIPVGAACNFSALLKQFKAFYRTQRTAEAASALAQMTSVSLVWFGLF